MLSESSLDLKLLFNGCISQLGAVALHLCSSAEGALQAPGLVLHLLKLALQPVKLWLALQCQHAVGNLEKLQPLPPHHAMAGCIKLNLGYIHAGPTHLSYHCLEADAGCSR